VEPKAPSSLDISDCHGAKSTIPYSANDVQRDEDWKRQKAASSKEEANQRERERETGHVSRRARYQPCVTTGSAATRSFSVMPVTQRSICSIIIFCLTQNLRTHAKEAQKHVRIQANLVQQFRVLDLERGSDPTEGARRQFWRTDTVKTKKKQKKKEKEVRAG